MGIQTHQLVHSHTEVEPFALFLVSHCIVVIEFLLSKMFCHFEVASDMVVVLFGEGGRCGLVC
jgi:hypothetical protein